MQDEPEIAALGRHRLGYLLVWDGRISRKALTLAGDVSGVAHALAARDRVARVLHSAGTKRVVNADWETAPAEV